MYKKHLKWDDVFSHVYNFSWHVTHSSKFEKIVVSSVTYYKMKFSQINEFSLNKYPKQSEPF